MNLGHLTSDQNYAMDLHLLCIRFDVLESLEYQLFARSIQSAFVELEKCIINVCTYLLLLGLLESIRENDATRIQLLG